MDLNQAYSVSLYLELPETPSNFDIGVFTAKMTVERRDEVMSSHKLTCDNKKKKDECTTDKTIEITDAKPIVGFNTVRK